MTIGDSSNWNDFFQQKLIPCVLNYIIDVWKQMPMLNQSDHEDVITIKLYSALKNAKDRNTHAFLIRYQDVEIDTELIKEIGRKDIVFFPSFQEEIYLCIEAKRLNAVVSGIRRSLADEYVKEGMQRFVNGKYAFFVQHGVMLAYVLDGNSKRAIRNVANNIKKRLKYLGMDEKCSFLDSTIRPNDPQTRETHHHRNHGNNIFKIHHLFLTNGPIVTKNQ